MFKNNFIIAWRNLAKQKMYSIIKIVGLALGIAACLLIALFIKDELGYDLHFKNGDRIYRVILRINDGDHIWQISTFPAPVVSAIKSEFPEIEEVGRMTGLVYFGAGSNDIRRTDKPDNIFEEGFVYTSQGLLDIFQPQMIYGNLDHALDGPETMIISKRKADKFFPGENPVGKTMILNNDRKRIYTISGVMEDPPRHSHFQYDFLMTLSEGLYPGEETNWNSQSSTVYTLLHPGIDVASLETKFKKLAKKNAASLIGKSEGPEADDLIAKITYRLQPISDIYLKSEGISDEFQHGDIRFVWLFGMIAIFIFIIACINFINLSTAKSSKRAMEVGLRKTVGASQKSLINQFLAESILLSFLSFSLGVVLVMFLLPYFNILSVKELVFPWNEWWLLPLLACAATFTGILAGLYPSFYISSFEPIAVLKGSIKRGCKNASLRNGLVIFQFSISIILITSTLVINNQVAYILNKKLGFDKDEVLLIQGTKSLGDQVTSFKNELLKLPDVKNVTVSDYLPVSEMKRNSCGFWNEGKQEVDEAYSAQLWGIDHDYIKTMGMNIVEGRDFSPEIAGDAEGCIINKTMARQLNLENPLDQTICTSFASWHVIGVVEDFHFESLKENIGGMCLTLGKSPDIVSVKIHTKNMSRTVASITHVWKTIAPYQQIRYSFLDERYTMMYDDVQRMGYIFNMFAMLAIIIACLGLFALSSFIIAQRTKEIGIRKVLGASVLNITFNLSKNFLTLVALANIIACPIAYFFMNRWLQDFAYRIHVRSWMFIVSGGIVILIALLTIGLQTIRAATANPIESLKYE
ncbi:ABC transporter permease [bacterium]|nr:ABC transporter permease [bacterium]